MRSFDPRRVGALECRAWETYYQRRWVAFLVASVGLVRAAFRMRWPATLYGAWLVLRANQAWAPFPDNDPDAARALMARFYGLLRRGGRGWTPSGPRRSRAKWWRAHREAQHDASVGPEALVDAPATLYAHVYDVDRAAVREAAALRAEAMDVSDRWVAAGHDAEHPLLETERALLGAVLRGPARRRAPLTARRSAPAPYGSSWRSGPWSSAQLRVLSTWMPALWSPLNGVTVFGQPAAAASSGELNHRPRWNVCTGAGRRIGARIRDRLIVDDRRRCGARARR